MRTALLGVLLTTTVAFAAPLLKRELITDCSSAAINQQCSIGQFEGVELLGKCEQISILDIGYVKVRSLPVCCARTNV
jgi:hypothetical protein